MKRLVTFTCLGVAAGLLGGCAQKGVSDIMGGNTESVQQAYSNPDLSMPPDLQLHPPSEAASYATTQPAATVPATTSAALAKPVTTSPVTASPSQPTGDVYEQNGISKVNPDGTPKTQQQLQAELKQVYLAKKQAANPNYGTVFNIGNIFSGN
jgi:hypothetical protein